MKRFIFALLLAAAHICQAAPPVFGAVTPGRALTFPLDYGAHPDYRTEWWYVTGWLKTADGKPLGFQVTFFRRATDHDRANPSAFAPKQLVVGHAALSDPALGKLVHDQRTVREGFGLAHAKTGTTDLKLDDWRMVRGADGTYQVSIASPHLNLNLTLAPTQPVLLQGQDGYSRKSAQSQYASYYYTEPQLKVRGTAAAGGSAARAVEGTAWLDHEWSTEALPPDAQGWDWVGANLADGSALMAFQIRSKQGGKLWAHATLRDAAGKVTQYAPDDVVFTPQAHWTSPRTNAVYPVATRITTGATHWQITPLQQDQELDSRRSTGAVYWEGAVTIKRDGAQAGQGYLEMTGYDRAMKL
ncbi:lipocalin-like domain-containing protein [Massilia scottii]|uniref:lipocalin-like domain-containing protein n=1 Tax=Massilia scottii TaxID=3057166 RepID=UPI002796970C|nr:lipocalin-like domain-containing protein [Massilia sp. CCM 9029]MDQ1830230.1 lipocalin-like domain-containing protein [Massilia sp. CCM 9029]